jgi:hypothetical protein
MKDKIFELSILNNSELLPDFLISKFKNKNYIIHTNYPTFILNNENKKIKFLQFIEEEEKNSTEIKKLIDKALAWYEVEIENIKNDK